MNSAVTRLFTLATLTLVPMLAFAHVSPPGCSINDLNASIGFPPGDAEVICGTIVPFTVEVNNGSTAGACDITQTPVVFNCPNPTTGQPTGPQTTLATADDFTAVPPSQKTYPAVSCMIGQVVGGVCSCGSSPTHQARVEAGPGILHDNNADNDIADVIKTVSVQCITTTTSSSTSTTSSSTTTSTSTSTSSSTTSSSTTTSTSTSSTSSSSTTSSSTTTSTSSTTSTTVPLTLSHFQCYETKRRRFAGIPVTLEDEFGTSTTTARRPERLCAPADKNGEDPGAPLEAAHLVGYTINRPVTNIDRQQITNQFGTVFVDLRRAERLMVPSSKSLSGTPAPLPPGALDHFQCYKITRSKGTPRFEKHTVQVTDQFGSRTITLGDPNRLCAPVNKNNEDPTAPTHPDHLLCYEIKKSPFKGLTAGIDNQFGQQSLELIQRVEFCVPSSRSSAATTTTTTTTTTSSTV